MSALWPPSPLLPGAATRLAAEPTDHPGRYPDTLLLLMLAQSQLAGRGGRGRRSGQASWRSYKLTRGWPHPAARRRVRPRRRARVGNPPVRVAGRWWGTCSVGGVSVDRRIVCVGKYRPRIRQIPNHSSDRFAVAFWNGVLDLRKTVVHTVRTNRKWSRKICHIACHLRLSFHTY